MRNPMPVRRLPTLGAIACAILMLAASWAAAADDLKRVLVLHSYHNGLGWTDSINAGIEATFHRSGQNIEIFYEFMDTKRIFDEKYLAKLADLLQYKLRNRHFDAVILVDDYAFQFLLAHHDDLVPGVPVVFCGVNYFKDEYIAGNPYFTGVVESFSIKGTIDAALRIDPQGRRVYSIVDNTITGTANRKLLDEIIPIYAGRLQFEYITDKDMTEVQDIVSRLPADSMVLLLAFTSDRSGNTFSLERSADLVTGACNRPVYSFWDFHLNHGIIGGRITTGTSQGEKAAELALRILGGEKPADIPVIKESPNRYIFDFTVLSRFGISADRLPEGSTLINRPRSFYEQYRQLVWQVIGAFAVLLIFAVVIAIHLLERRVAQAKLKKSEDKFRSLVETTGDWIWEVDAGGRYTYVSPKVTELLGYSPEEVMGKTPFDLMPPAEAERVGKIFKEILGKRDPIVRLKNLNRHRDGRDVILETTGVPIFDADGNLAGYRGIDRDITDRQRSEEALQQSENRLKAVFHAVADISFIITAVTGPEPKILEFSPGAEKMFGYCREEMIGGLVSRLHLPQDVARFSEAFRNMREGRPGFNGEATLVRRSGETFPALFSTYPLFDVSGRIMGVLGVSIDISEQKRILSALAESEARFRDLAELLPETIFEVDPEGRLLYTNESGYRHFGHTREDFDKGLKIRDLIDPSEHGKLRENMSRIVRGENLGLSEYTAIRKDGTRFPVMVRSSVILKNGRPVGLRGFLIDLSERKRLEEQVHMAQRMESIGRLAGGIAHDFNNLLMGIQGRTSLILMDLDPAAPQMEHLKGIEEYVKSAAQLTKQLLGFARSGKYDLKSTDLNILIENTADMFGRTKKELHIHKKLADDLLAVVVDRGQIEQVLLNLYINAWQAMPGGGHLTLETRNRGLSADKAAIYGISAGDYAVIWVSDTGIGMDAKTKEQIFEPFFSTKSRGRGTGLGLASSYGIIKNHGGAIVVDSEPGCGAAFTVLLPATRQIPEIETPLVDALKRGTETVLLVDDEQMIIEVGSDLLRHLGYRVLTAGGGNAALAIYGTHRGEIDLVILDMVMPDLNGKETYLRLKAMDTGVRVLLSSGYSMNGEASEILKSGCDGFLQKPFNTLQLSRKLRDILDAPVSSV